MKKNYAYLIIALFLSSLQLKAVSTEKGYIGVMPSMYADQQLGYGTPIDRVMDNSPAQNAGLKRGDVITAVNGHLLNGGCDMITFISAHHADELVHINYVRDGKPAEVELVLTPKIYTSTTMYVIDKVLGENNAWRFRDDNSTVVLIDKRNARFSKEVGGKTQSFDINFDNVILGDVKYFALKDKIELIKSILDKEKLEDINLFAEGANTKMINFVLSIDPTSQVPSININSLSIPSKSEKLENTQEIILEVNELNIYPNPSNGIFNVNFVTTEKGKANISIMNMEGKIIYTENMNNFSGSYSGNINISNVAAGFYTIIIKVGDKQLFRKINIDN